ncbi:uncharacterized protein [Diabrotica undecimpunctata]|uniref:uncharacterized protein n=1 Tax=Diabrotica undecimpunctata TaxID=50387 RepID=UPI003B631BCF
MSAAKRSRSVNFTKEEELLLIEEVSKYKSIIECKTTNKLNWNEKENAWKKIVANFNSKNFHTRTLDQVRAKYDNIKSKARKEVAKLRCYQAGTGGGPCSSFNLDTSTDAVLNLMNLKTVMGLTAEFDSDSIEINKDIQNDVGELFEMDVNNILIVEESSTTSKDEFEHSDNNTDSKISLEVVEQDSPRKNWNKYVPEKLKKTAHQKLRPKVLNPAIEAKKKYYEHKLEVLIEENQRQKEKEEREKAKHERDIREQDLKIKILEMELKLKQKILAQQNL